MEFEEVFSFKHLWNSYLNCCKGVNWKTSTINFRMRAIQHIAEIRKQLINGTYRSKGFCEFQIFERGKHRTIKAVHISERVVQKCLCDYYIVPKMKAKLIHDSGATVKGKGLTFSVNRLRNHLQKYFRKYGKDGYILTFDFKQYFESIDHKLLLEKAREIIDNDKVFNLYKYFVECFGERGLGLGSQISQISALFYLAKLDHTLKEFYGCKFYGRYMDDCYIIHNDKNKIQAYKNTLLKLTEKLKLKASKNKCKIQKLNHFRFLNRNWCLTERNYIKCKPSHKTIVRFRRRYRKIKEKDESKLFQFEASINGYIKNFKNRRLFYVLSNKIKT